MCLQGGERQQQAWVAAEGDGAEGRRKGMGRGSLKKEMGPRIKAVVGEEERAPAGGDGAEGGPGGGKEEERAAPNPGICGRLPAGLSGEQPPSPARGGGRPVRLARRRSPPEEPRIPS